MHGFSNSNPTRAAALPVSSGDLIADRRYAIAKDLEARGDLAAAADLLTQALERAPGFCVAWFAFAEVRERLGDRTGAAEALEREHNRADLVVAADAFVYLPDLRRVCRAAAQVLENGGLFAFTTETHEGAGVVLGEKLRYAHSAEHLRDALEAAALCV